MQHRTRIVIAGALAVALPFIGALAPIGAEEAKSEPAKSQAQPATTDDWCQTPAIAQALAAKQSHPVEGKVVAFDAARGILKIATEVKVASAKTEGDTTKTVTETKTEIVEVAIIPSTMLFKLVKAAAPKSNESAAASAPRRLGQALEIVPAKLAEIAAQQTIVANTRRISSEPNKAGQLVANTIIVSEAGAK
jgi:hypothetical protein